MRLFLERSNMARAFFPGEYDLGVRVQGGWRWLRWQAAVDERQSGGRQAVRARRPDGVEGRPRARRRRGAAVAAAWASSGGVSGLCGTGFSRGSPTTKATLVWRDANADGQVDITEIVGVVGQPATPSRTFPRYALGGDLRVSVRAAARRAAHGVRRDHLGHQPRPRDLHRRSDRQRRRPARARLVRGGDAAADAVVRGRRALRSLRSRQRRAPAGGRERRAARQVVLDAVDRGGGDVAAVCAVLDRVGPQQQRAGGRADRRAGPRSAATW